MPKSSWAKTKYAIFESVSKLAMIKMFFTNNTCCSIWKFYLLYRSFGLQKIHTYNLLRNGIMPKIPWTKPILSILGRVPKLAVVTLFLEPHLLVDFKYLFVFIFWN